jgi:hypothetical protein
MRVYMGTYAKYNNGNLSGAWLKLSNYADWDDFMAAAHKLHSDEKHPELMAQDWEGPDWAICEYGVAQEAWKYMALDDGEQAIVAHLCSNRHVALGDALDQLQDGDFRVYHGALDCYAHEYFEDCYDLPKEVQQYLDLDGYARDLILNGDAELMGDYAAHMQDHIGDTSRSWFMS